MDISTEILQSRVSLIEKLLVNEKKEGDSLNYAVVLSSRLVEINNKLNNIEASVPGTAACVQIVADLKPYILQSRNRLYLMEEKVENFLTKKKEIMSYIEDLSTIQKLQPVLNTENFTGIEFLASKLAFLEQQYEPLIMETKRQSQEIDELLELYEKAMRVVSDSAVNLQERLTQLINK